MRTFGFPEFLFILEAAKWTLALSAIAFVGGAILGLAIALMRTSESTWARGISTTFIQIFQGTPLLLQLFLVFFGAPVLGLDINPWVAAGVALILNSAAFLGEIWRGCIQAVPRSQWEAAECLALTRLERMRRVILPQALRIATPPTVGFLVQIIKNTSIASLVVGYAELSYNAKVLNNSTFQPFLYFGCAVVLYFILCYPLSRWSRALERKLNAARG